MIHLVEADHPQNLQSKFCPEYIMKGKTFFVNELYTLYSFLYQDHVF